MKPPKKSMNIHDKSFPRMVRYTGENGFVLDHDLCTKLGLEIGEEYSAEGVVVSEWSSMVFLKGMKRGINTCVFEEVHG
jgi:hypothetical protein